MNNRYVKLRIPFASKAYIWKKDNGFKIKGNAFYIFDIKTKKYIDEYIQIIESNFRITDKAMIKPTEYYKNKKVKHFRSNFLDILVNKNPLDIDKEEYFNLNKDSIMQINILKMKIQQIELYTHIYQVLILLEQNKILKLRKCCALIIDFLVVILQMS